MGQDLHPAVRKYQLQFMGEPFPVMDDRSAVVFLFRPVVHKLHRLPVRNVKKLAFATHAEATTAALPHLSAPESTPAPPGDKRPIAILDLRPDPKGYRYQLGGQGRTREPGRKLLASPRVRQDCRGSKALPDTE